MELCKLSQVSGCLGKTTHTINRNGAIAKNRLGSPCTWQLATTLSGLPSRPIESQGSRGRQPWASLPERRWRSRPAERPRKSTLGVGEVLWVCCPVFSDERRNDRVQSRRRLRTSTERSPSPIQIAPSCTVTCSRIGALRQRRHGLTLFGKEPAIPCEIAGAGELVGYRAPPDRRAGGRSYTHPDAAAARELVRSNRFSSG